MVTFVSMDWVENRLEHEDILLMDTRGSMRYLMGHLRGAVTVPLRKVFGAEGRLLSEDALAELLGSVGLTDNRTPVLYDRPQGQNAAMIAWVLQYLGRTDVHVMDSFYDEWVAQGYAIFYRPVATASGKFTTLLDSSVRVQLEVIAKESGITLVDFRTEDEFLGREDNIERPGHIPSAKHLDWQNLVGEGGRLLASEGKIRKLFEDVNIGRDDQVVAYCRTGPRASLGYMALKQLGYNVRLYDGSFAEWSQRGMPVEM